MLIEPYSGDMSMEETDPSEINSAGTGRTARGKEVLSQGGKNLQAPGERPDEHGEVPGTGEVKRHGSVVGGTVSSLRDLGNSSTLRKLMRYL